MKTEYDIVVVGGGFFGCEIAYFLAEKGLSVLLLEKESELLLRASLNNQARLHNGYHYPRSILTASRSRVNYKRFQKEYEETLHTKTEAYYVIPHQNSFVTASQFQGVMGRIGAPLKKAPKNVTGLFSDLIEEVFEVDEVSFDADILRDLVAKKLERSSVEVLLGTRVQKIQKNSSGIEISFLRGQAKEKVLAQKVFNVTYSGINQLYQASNIAQIDLIQQWTEMIPLSVPRELQDLSVTVMCGPFFSLMPFPPLDCHVLSHVRYTPHIEWQEGEGHIFRNHEEMKPPASAGMCMLKDARRFLPALSDAEQCGESIWEVKTLLPLSQEDASRPILFQQHPEVEGLFTVLGGKIDNIYDVLEEIERVI